MFFVWPSRLGTSRVRSDCCVSTLGLAALLVGQSSERALESLVLLAYRVCIEGPGLLGSANGVAGLAPFRFHLGWEGCLILLGVV